MDAATLAILLRTAERNLRRKFAADLPGLATFADGIASESQGSAITLTATSSDGGAQSGEVTMPREIWLSAAESLLADPTFNPDAPAQPPSVIHPDYRLASI